MECGILRGRCSPDSGGSGVRNLGDAGGAPSRWHSWSNAVAPAARAGSELLWGTWALQAATAIPTLRVCMASEAPEPPGRHRGTLSAA